MGACTRGVGEFAVFLSAGQERHPVTIAALHRGRHSGLKGDSSMRVRVACIVVAMVALLPSAAHAQASITGVVKDSSGAVLPGVTVEASSPDLIEKSRTVVTDGAGQYRLVDL